MKRFISCEFNIDTACVELHRIDSSMISIDCTAVEDTVAKNIRQQSKLDYLVYNGRRTPVAITVISKGFQ